MADLNKLAAALRAGAEAQADVEGLQSQYDSANSLVNTGAPAARSFLSGIVGNLDRQRGREQLRDVQPRLQAARRAAAEGKVAETMYGYETDADKTQYSRGRDDINDQWREGGVGRALKQAAGIRRQQNADASSKHMINVKTGDQATVQQNKFTGQLTIDGTPVNSSDWVDYNRPPSKSGGSGGSGADRAAAQKEAYKLYTLRTDVEDVSSIAKNFSQEDVKQLEDVHTRLKHKLIDTMTPEAWEQFAETELKGYSPEVKRFLNRVRTGSAELRHSLFGSALSSGERRLSEGFLPSAGGLSLSDVMLRLDEIDGRSGRKLENLDTSYNTDFSTRRGFKGLTEWKDTLREAEKAAPVKTTTAEDDAALKWLKENPNHPDSGGVMARLKSEGKL